MAEEKDDRVIGQLPGFDFWLTFSIALGILLFFLPVAVIVEVLDRIFLSACRILGRPRPYSKSPRGFR